MNENDSRHSRQDSLIKQSTEPEVLFLSDEAHLTTLPETAKTNKSPHEAPRNA